MFEILLSISYSLDYLYTLGEWTCNNLVGKYKNCLKEKEEFLFCSFWYWNLL